MGILDDAIKEHLELKRAHGAAEEEIRRKEAEAFGPVRQEVVAEAPPAEAGPTASDAETVIPPAADATPAELETVVPPAAETVALPASETVVPPAADTVEPPAADTVEPPAADIEPPAADIEPAHAAADDPYAVHPGDHPVPDPHREGEPGGKDPAWREDTDFFADEPAYPEETAAHAPAQAGAGELPESRIEPGPPVHAEDERHPALHDTDEHFQPGHHPPEPVFRDEPTSPAAPEGPIAPPEEAAAQPAGSEGDEDVLEETPEFLQDAPEHDRLWFEQKPPRDFDFGE